MEPGLSFWLRYVEAEGGLVEPRADTAVAVLPDHLQERFDLPEDVAVTADAETAREDGALLLTAGHPVLDTAADSALDRGDVGCRRLAWPSSHPPSDGTLLERIRDQLPVDHGKVDLDGASVRVYLPVLEFGALVNYTLSFDDRFSEREDVRVDAVTETPLPDAAMPGRMPEPEAASALNPSELPCDLESAVAAAHDAVAQRAVRRQETLAKTVRTGQVVEVERTEAYYDAALESIARRADKANPERRAAYEAQADATRVERARRLAEVEEKFRPSFTIRPFRLHLLLVPALRVPVVIRRGPRSYPLTLSWLLGSRRLAAAPCSHCGTVAPLVATRHRLGCRDCLSAR